MGTGRIGRRIGHMCGVATLLGLGGGAAAALSPNIAGAQTVTPTIPSTGYSPISTGNPASISTGIAAAPAPTSPDIGPVGGGGGDEYAREFSGPCGTLWVEGNSYGGGSFEFDVVLISEGDTSTPQLGDADWGTTSKTYGTEHFYPANGDVLYASPSYLISIPAGQEAYVQVSGYVNVSGIGLCGFSGNLTMPA